MGSGLGRVRVGWGLVRVGQGLGWAVTGLLGLALVVVVVVVVGVSDDRGAVPALLGGGSLLV